MANGNKQGRFPAPPDPDKEDFRFKISDFRDKDGRWPIGAPSHLKFEIAAPDPAAAVFVDTSRYLPTPIDIHRGLAAAPDP